jgi:pimeloyl-ACP methyl ester carboxylesterase
LLVIWLSFFRHSIHECYADQSGERESTASEPAGALYLTAKEFDVEGLPQQQYHLGVDYKNGALKRVDLAGTVGFVIKPTGRVDPARRWVWIVPLWLALPSAHGNCTASWYVEGLLEAGFHVAGFDVGTSLGSPKGAELFRQFQLHLVEANNLSPKARMMAVSNGGLITYGYAVRYPKRIDRIFAVYPAVDFRSWPKLERVVGPGAITPKGLSYDLKPGEMVEKIEQFNPIDKLAPLARARVPLLHLHGDADKLVPLDPNSTLTAERYRNMGGEIELKVMEGSVHGGMEFFTNQHALQFLLAASGEDDESAD